ncbi:MAG: histidinol-phosphatase HisJ family protein [Candidatus Zixiibacteriota bacterium]|nr:MAG: histidinol-phosphatase HisJ family protein [candidate division Zixibacteria bacterium]
MPEIDDLEPLQLPGLADYHCHCDYSIDSAGTLDDYCHAALKRGIAELCFTTHYDSSLGGSGEDNFIRVKGEMLPSGIDSLRYYVEDVRRVGELFYPVGLSVKLGLEFGWYDGCQRHLAELMSAFEFDYMLCGIHEIFDACFSCHTSYERCFAGRSAAEVVSAYAKQIIRAAESGLFDTVAHLDYLRKYGLAHYGDSLDKAFYDYLPDIFTALKTTDTALEINTSGLRKGMDSYFPEMKVVNAARKAGVNIGYIGSDAHQPEDVGFDFDAAAALIPRPVGKCESE